MTHVPFPSPAILAAAKALNARLAAETGDVTLTFAHAHALHRSGELVSMASQAAGGPVYLQAEDFSLIATDYAAVRKEGTAEEEAPT